MPTAGATTSRVSYRLSVSFGSTERDSSPTLRPDSCASALRSAALGPAPHRSRSARGQRLSVAGEGLWATALGAGC